MNDNNIPENILKELKKEWNKKKQLLINKNKALKDEIAVLKQKLYSIDLDKKIEISEMSGDFEKECLELEDKIRELNREKALVEQERNLLLSKVRKLEDNTTRVENDTGKKITEFKKEYEEKIKFFKQQHEKQIQKQKSIIQESKDEELEELEKKHMDKIEYLKNNFEKDKKRAVETAKAQLKCELIRHFQDVVDKQQKIWEKDMTEKEKYFEKLGLAWKKHMEDIQKND